MTDSWVITIDGPAGVGKSTVARMLAERLGAVFLDTGATYRAVTVAALEKGTDLQDVDAVVAVMQQTDFQFTHENDVLKVFVDGVDKTEKIRRPDITEQVRHVACQPALRIRLVQMQRDFAAQFAKVVTEGRDQGTVVFPNARWKFFLEADPEERARRRQKDLAAAGKTVELDTLKQQILSRDTSDINRSVGPLVPAADAIHIDTTHSNAQQVVDQMLQAIEEKDHG